MPPAADGRVFGPPPRVRRRHEDHQPVPAQLGVRQQHLSRAQRVSFHQRDTGATAPVRWVTVPLQNGQSTGTPPSAQNDYLIGELLPRIGFSLKKQPEYFDTGIDFRGVYHDRLGLSDHSTGGAEPLGDESAQVITHTVVIPRRPRQQVLHPVRCSIPGLFGQSPTVLRRQRGKQRCHKCFRRRTGLPPSEPARDPSHQLVHHPIRAATTMLRSTATTHQSLSTQPRLDHAAAVSLPPGTTNDTVPQYIATERQIAIGAPAVTATPTSLGSGSTA